MSRITQYDLLAAFEGSASPVEQLGSNSILIGRAATAPGDGRRSGGWRVKSALATAVGLVRCLQLFPITTVKHSSTYLVLHSGEIISDMIVLRSKDNSTH